MVTLLGSRFAMTKPPFDQKPTPAIIFWTLEMGLSCSARVRRLTGILRRAHVTIFIVDYRNFQSQLSGFSRIFEDFDWAPVIFTQDVQRKTYWIFLWNFFFKKSKIGHGGCTQNWIPSTTTVTEFSKTFPVFYKWPDLTDVQVMLRGTVWRKQICMAAVWRVQSPRSCIRSHARGLARGRLFENGFRHNFSKNCPQDLTIG